MVGPNYARGDVQVELPQTVLVLRPSFQAIAQLEAHFGRGILEIARDYHNGKITRAADFLALLKAGAEAGGEDLPDNLAAQMIEKGLVQLIEPLGQFLAHACGLHGA